MNSTHKGLIVIGVALVWALTAVGVARLVQGPSAARPSPGEGAATFTLPPEAVGPAVQRVRERGVLRVLMDTGTPAWAGSAPMYVVAESGKPDGFDVRIARHLATRLGVPDIQLVHEEYPSTTRHLAERDDADVLISGFIPDGAAHIVWSDPYLEFGLCLIVKKGGGVRTIDDLYGKAVGVYDDDAVYDAVRGLVKGYTEIVRSEAGYLDQLLTGRFAGFIYDQPFTAAEIKEFYDRNPHRRDSLQIAQFNLTEAVYAVGVRASEPDLLAALNLAIADLRASDAYRADVRQWLDVDQEPQAPTGGGRTLTVRAGDTLTLIAERELGDRQRWREIWQLNKRRFSSPDTVEVGDVLTLPTP